MIRPNEITIRVYCDMDTECGGWTVSSNTVLNTRVDGSLFKLSVSKTWLTPGPQRNNHI